MEKKELKKISKRLSYVLRHRPDSINIELEIGGWVDVNQLLSLLKFSGQSLSRELLETVVRENDKQRFEFSTDHSRIRARQGHSAEVDLEYEPSTPPDTLYHGTATRNLESILREGLNKQKRHHVHLSTNKQTMIEVAQRHGKPVLLEVDSKRMLADGYPFFVTGNDVWLTDNVPTQYLKVVETETD